MVIDFVFEKLDESASKTCLLNRGTCLAAHFTVRGKSIFTVMSCKMFLGVKMDVLHVSRSQMNCTIKVMNREQPCTGHRCEFLMDFPYIHSSLFSHVLGKMELQRHPTMNTCQFSGLFFLFA